MHKSIKILITLSIVLIIIGGAGSLLTAQSVTASESVEDTSIIDANDITDIQIQAVNEKISVEKGDDNSRAKVKWNGKTQLSEDRLSVKTHNGQLSIDLDSEPFYLFSIGTDLQETFFRESELIVSLPEKMYSAINVNNTNGKVNLDNLMAEDVDVNLTNGQLNMKNIAGNVTAQTVNGEINLITPDLDRDIDLSTTTGRITIQTEKRPTNALLDVQTEVGQVNLFDEEDRQTVYGDGEHHIKLNTTVGLIKVEKRK